MYIPRDYSGNIQVNKMASHYGKKILSECMKDMWSKFKKSCSKAGESVCSALSSMCCVSMKTIARVALAIVSLGISECVFSCITCYKAKCNRDADPYVRYHVIP